MRLNLYTSLRANCKGVLTQLKLTKKYPQTNHLSTSNILKQPFPVKESSVICSLLPLCICFQWAFTVWPGTTRYEWRSCYCDISTLSARRKNPKSCTSKQLRSKLCLSAQVEVCPSARSSLQGEKAFKGRRVVSCSEELWKLGIQMHRIRWRWARHLRTPGSGRGFLNLWVDGRDEGRVDFLPLDRRRPLDSRVHREVCYLRVGVDLSVDGVSYNSALGISISVSSGAGVLHFLVDGEGRVTVFAGALLLPMFAEEDEGECREQKQQPQPCSNNCPQWDFLKKVLLFDSRS